MKSGAKKRCSKRLKDLLNLRQQLLVRSDEPPSDLVRL